MIRIIAFLIFFSLICNPAIAAELKKINLDDASVLGTTIQTDSDVKAEGKASVKITTLFPTTICLGVISGLDVENGQLVFNAQVKSDIEGTAYLEMWAHIGKGRYFSKGMNSPVKGRSDWKTIQTPFIFRKGQNPDKITLNLVINGLGTVWIDDVILLKKPLN